MLKVSSDANLKRVLSNQYEISDEEGGGVLEQRPATFNLDRDVELTPTFKEKYIEPNLGLLFLAGAYLFNSSMVVSTKVLEGDPHEETTIKPLQILLVRMAITYLGTLIYMFMYRDTIPCIPFGEPRLRKWLLLRGFMGFISVFGTYFSLMYLSICDAILITFLEPSLIIILAWLILKEKVHKTEFLGCFVSFIGVVLIVRPPFIFGTQVVAESAAESSNPVERLIAALVALAGAFSMAGVYIVIRYIGNQVHAIMNVSYFALVTLVISFVGILVVPSMQFQMPHSFKEWTLFINLGVSGFCLQLLLTLGIQRERAGRGSLITYTQLIYSLFWDAVLYKHLPTFWSWCGMFLIIGSTIYVLSLRHAGDEKDQDSVLPTPLYDEEQQRSSLDIPMEDMNVTTRRSHEITDKD